VYAPANDIWQMVVLVYSSYMVWRIFILFVDLTTHDVYLFGTKTTTIKNCKYVYDNLVFWFLFFHLMGGFCFFASFNNRTINYIFFRAK
jgi:hypothetical protein